MSAFKRHRRSAVRGTWGVGVCVVMAVVLFGTAGWVVAADKNGEVTAARAELAEMTPPSPTFVTISKVVRPSVVSIVTLQSAPSRVRRVPRPDEWPFDGPNPFREYFERVPQQEARALGSGVIVDERGYILTNNHVVTDAKEITVYLDDESEHKAELIGTDPKTDLAVIKIDAKDLVVGRLGDSDVLEVGEWVLAFGAPFGLAHSVSAGIVSAKGRSQVGVIRHAFSYENFIQTDAAINRGNSGGPLVNMKGEVIGINAAIVTGSGGYQGVGFAIPSNLCRKVLNDIIKYKKVVRGFLGVQIRDLSNKDVEDLKLDVKEGVYVETVYPDTPADKAGLKKGDVIVAFNDTQTAKMKQLRSMVAAHAVGKAATLKVLRDAKEVTLEVTIAEQPDTEIPVAGASWHDEELGMTLQTLSPAVARILEVEGEVGVYAQEEGVLVVEVDPDGLAAKNDIKRNDLIREMSNEDVTSLSDYRRIREKADVKKGVLLFVKTGRKARMVLVK